jgi:hypothetical protein
MKIISPLFFLLAAVLAGPTHALGCSGGDAGGIDATGNQCNAPANVPASASESADGVFARADKMRGIHASGPAVAPPVRSAKMSGQASAPTVVAKPASRMVRTADPAVAPVKTAKMQNWSEANCSGGTYGGMDVNGNQCGEAPVLAEVYHVAHARTH